MSEQPRYRWAIEQMSLDGHPNDRRKWSGPLGCGWIDYAASLNLPAYVDCWPASYRTRREAREASRALRERDSNWRFRPVKIGIRVEVVT